MRQPSPDEWRGVDKPPVLPRSSTRNRILITALDLIGKDGARGFSVNGILRRGGCSKRSFYTHFKGLDDLCLACYDLLRRWNGPRLVAHQHKDLHDFLMSFGAETLNASQTRRHFAVVYFFAELAMTYPVFLKAQQELTEHYQESLVEQMTQLVPTSVDKGTLRDLAAYMSIVLDGIAAHRLMFEDPGRMARIWPVVVDSVERQLSGELSRGSRR